jgi:protease-4
MYKKSVILVIAAVIGISLLSIAILGRHGSGTRQDKIAIIHVDGVIMGGSGQEGLLGGNGGTDQLIKELHEAEADPSVKAIVLRINSPGGSAPAAQEVGEELNKARASGKIIVTSMADMAASGGYWLAACTDKIYANPATLTGSIGVYIPYTNWQGLYKKLGIHEEEIKSGPHKDILSPNRPMTSKERTIIQTMVNDMYNQFVMVVAKGRHMDPAKVRRLADGRIYTGSQAKQLGLVDELGDMYDAIAGAKELAGIKGKVKIQEYGKPSPWQRIFGGESLSKVLVEKLLVGQGAEQSQIPIMAPLAMPSKWQVN